MQRRTGSSKRSRFGNVFSHYGSVWLRECATDIAGACIGLLRVDQLECDIISGLETGNDGAEFGDIVDGVAVDGGNDHALGTGKSELEVSKGAGLNGLDEHAMESRRSALRQVADGDAKLDVTGHAGAIV